MLSARQLGTAANDGVQAVIPGASAHLVKSTDSFPEVVLPTQQGLSPQLTARHNCDTVRGGDWVQYYFTVPKFHPWYS
jgi:hypothetical protein